MRGEAPRLPIEPPAFTQHLAGRRIMVATPMHNNACVGDYVESVVALQNHLWGNGADMHLLRLASISDVAMARNLCAGLFLQSDCTDLLFVDAYMGFEAADVVRMLGLGVDVAGAICPTKGFDWGRIAAVAAAKPGIEARLLELCAPRFGTFKALPGAPLLVDQAFEVAGIGAAIMAIRRSVFGRLRQAFPERRIAVARNRKLNAMFPPGLEAIGAPFHASIQDEETVGEDINFCLDWRSIGGAVWGCPWFTVRHVGNYAFTSSLAAIRDAGGTIEVFA